MYLCTSVRWPAHILAFSGVVSWTVFLILDSVAYCLDHEGFQDCVEQIWE